ncbi:hypothetical protein LTR59_011854 [Friedmanniomyces endolithicus]|nr:hypothetical protein LTR94_010910 [Friedmanniomyces endolithicus]KAK0783194.1 hypothetical protein LTR59_011854 [Friedmanniomyces endolithicus]KAK0788142.1 hypothetical protein LTR38_011431 [Friedmanniomyces endolithicus]KAK0819120.1 hypothetical protein LTR75_002324 [Friedmanniomyces endolithicus]KAK0851618.1 hypothetical protein LTR03_003875 [Friedmanniomyces endolithicus]
MEKTLIGNSEASQDGHVRATDAHDLEKSDSIRDESTLGAFKLGSSDNDSVRDDRIPDDQEKALSHEPSTPHHEPPPPTTAADWNGPDDPDNPLNWTMRKRALHIAPIAFLSFATTTGSSMITPATPEIARYFDVSRTASILSLSLFVLGLGLGPIIAAPISEKFGRGVVYKASGPLYMLFILGSGFSKSFGGLLICRLLAGMSGGPVLAVGSGTIADMFPPRHRAIASGTYVMAPFLGPALGPVIGGFAAQFKDWRWTQWCTIFIALAAYLTILPMSETYKKVILQRRAKRLNIPPPPTPPMSALTQLKILVTITIARPLVMLATEPIVMFFSLYNAFTFSVLFAFFAAYPYTFETVYGFNTWQYGLTFLGIGLGVILAVLTNIVIDRLIYTKKTAQALKEGRHMAAPEHRLYCAMVGSVGIPIGLFWFAWSARADVHWISPVLAGIPFAWGNLCVFMSAAMYLIDVYGSLNGASAMAANGLARYGLGADVPAPGYRLGDELIGFHQRGDGRDPVCVLCVWAENQGEESVRDVEDVRDAITWPPEAELFCAPEGGITLVA